MHTEEAGGRAGLGSIQERLICVLFLLTTALVCLFVMSCLIPGLKLYPFFGLWIVWAGLLSMVLLVTTWIIRKGSSAQLTLDSPFTPVWPLMIASITCWETEREEDMPKNSLPKIQELRVRAVRVPMKEPHQTASGVITESPLVLTDIITDTGISWA
jgi:hypothetical protein